MISKIAVIGLSILIVSCAGVRPRYHRVSQGETLREIAGRYHVAVESLVSKNRRALRRGFYAGKKLYIPYEDDLSWPPMPKSIGIDTRRRAPFMWPVVGYVSSGFGRRHNRDHDGIDIPARAGTYVRASRSGHVIYAGNRIKGYGNLVIIRHADEFSTVYAHLSRMVVHKGQFVSRGQTIGHVGKTGHANGSHLHFEIREGSMAVNPLLYLQGQFAHNIVGR